MPESPAFPFLRTALPPLCTCRPQVVHKREPRDSRLLSGRGEHGWGAERGEGVGLANTRTRLETLYGTQGSITVSTLRDNRFLVSIQFPLTTVASETVER